jgi:hypothetical protein
MAPKKPSDSAPRSNKIRFVLVEADISDGNLSELTHAITSALKPTITPVHRQLPARQVMQALPEVSESAQEEEVDGAPDDEVQEEAGEDTPRTPKPRAKLALPKYLPDLDLSGNGTSFKDYIEAKPPRNHVKRYLSAAMWLKEHGNSPTINADKVYTCYKTASWPLGINDWDSNFRGAVKRDLMRRVSPGEYAITPIGEAALQKGDE